MDRLAIRKSSRATKPLLSRAVTKAVWTHGPIQGKRKEGGEERPRASKPYPGIWIATTFDSLARSSPLTETARMQSVERITVADTVGGPCQ